MLRYATENVQVRKLDAEMCVYTVLICHLRYATADTVIRKALCAATRSKTIFVYFLRKAYYFQVFTTISFVLDLND